MKNFRRVIQEVFPFWPRILLALVLGTLAISSSIGLMATSSYLLARAALHPPILDLMVTIVGVRFFGIARAVFRYLERLVSHDLTFRVLSRLRVLVYQGIEPLVPSRLGDLRSGDFLSRIVGDVEIQQNLFLRVLAPPLVAVLVLLGYGGFLAGFDVRFSFLLAGSFLLVGIGIPFFVKGLSRDIGKQRVKLKAKLQILIFDLIKGMPEILSFREEENFRERLYQVQSELIQVERKFARMSGISHALIGIVMNLGMWAALILGVLLVESGELNGLYLGMLALGTLASFEAVLPLPIAFQHLGENQAAGKRLMEIINNVEEECCQEETSHKNLQVEQGFVEPREFSLEFSDVDFRYHKDGEWALKDISFKIPAQGRIALVGPSGAGKSSVVNVLLRFWDYEAGTIRIGGMDLKDFKPNKVHSLIGVLTQRTHLFHATVKENLLLAKPDATDEELFEVARRAKIHDFILTLPQGYNSVIGEEGTKLSGGQQQRLAIARVLLKNAPILILDEATTGLDPVIERDVLKEIFSLMQGRTILMISHHLETLKDMDEILILNQGKIVERGVHKVLLSQDGFYRKLWEDTYSARA
jgi:ATP-binding cassette, subfamily C, bacterial CydC